MEGDGEDQESPPCGRNWAELQRDVLIVIFLKMGILGVLRVAGSVCRSWRRVSKEGLFWRRIVMTNHDFGDRACILKHPTRLFIDRSGGELEEFSVKEFGDDDLLYYLCERVSGLKKLCLISCSQISNEAIAETAKRQPLLEEIQISFGSFSEKLFEIVGKECLQLKSLKFNRTWSMSYRFDPDDDVALEIANNMHQLRHLQLIGDRLTNKGLKAIIDGCSHLETLDIRGCYDVNMDADMQTCCEKLKSIRLPGDSMIDYEFNEQYGVTIDDFARSCLSDELQPDMINNIISDLDYIDSDVDCGNYFEGLGY